ncbi:MAG: hypothetical protein HPY79_07805 [Bacteroidales bacterium]|nr:hypothetical protein [Bacteroidales bacterium]
MKYCFLIFFAFSLSTVFAQVKTTRYIHVKYSYIVENVNSELQLQKLQNDFKQIKGVDEVKYTYKPEKQKAQYIIYTTQQIRQSEADEEFHITSLKEAIIKNNLVPNELKEEIVEQ